MIETDQIRENIWLTSFGDLLTLLLCFFLATLSGSSLNPLSPAGIERIKSGNHSSFMLKLYSSKQPLAYGTSIAQLSDGVLELTATFFSDDFVTLGETLSQNAERRFPDVVPSGYTLEAVEVSTCYPSETGSISTSWLGSITRAKALSRQLIDRGFGSIREEILGPNCRTLGKQSAVAEIRFRYQKNG